jgi:hypothetical protein
MPALLIPITGAIGWTCRLCAESGTIAGREGTFWDDTNSSSSRGGEVQLDENLLQATSR